MNQDMTLAASGMQAAQLTRCEVLGVQVDGSVLVGMPDDGSELLCDQLVMDHTSPPNFGPGDPVLVLVPPSLSERGIVIGRVGAASPAVRAADAAPDELVLEAKRNLTLRCGAGSITIRADGKILIKGKDLVSHAQRVNRIKGGSVAIN